MLALRLFGGLELINPECVRLGRARQRRRLALLAVLATPPGAAVSREKLIGLLWPDVAPDDARHRLTVALYDLRQALGEDAMLVTALHVTLRPGAIGLDVADFEAALARHDWETAGALYTGPFLDGIYLLDAPGFEHWVDERRAQLERSAARAFEQLADTRTQRGDFDGAVEAWRRLTRIDPFSSSYAVGLMRALDAAGDRTGALRHAHAHAALLRTELDIAPTAEVELLANELKSAFAPPLATQNSSPTTVDSTDAIDDLDAAPSESTRATSTRRGKVRRWAAVALTSIALMIVTAALRMLPTLAQRVSAAGDALPLSGKAAAALRSADAEMNAGRYDAAVATLERAVRADSAHALPHFRLAVATLWADQPGSNLDVHLERALARRHQLGDDDGVLLDAFVAWRRGQWNRAEALYRRVLSTQPDLLEARFQLGETLFHYNAVQGRPTAESRAEFERVLAVEPRHHGALWHLAQLAAQDGQLDRFTQLTDRIVALQPDGVRRLEVDVLRAVVLQQSAAFDSLLLRLRNADESLLFGTGWRLAVFARDFNAAERVFSLLTEDARGSFAQAIGHTHLLMLDVARGRTSAAQSRWPQLAELREAQSPWPAQLLALAADSAPSQSALRELRARIERELKTVAAGTEPPLPAIATLGAVCALLGDSAVALGIAQQLEKASAEQTNDRARSQAATIRALHARRLHRHEDVINWVDRGFVQSWFGDGVVGPLQAYALQRFMRAEALLALGRLREADSWFATIGGHDPADLVFLTAALRHRATIAVTRGEYATVQQLRAQLRMLQQS